jgi:ketosteroid isomerase-like protein
MEGQPYSLAFRKGYPKFNGLIWAYHWLQVGLYEPLVAGRNADERQTGVLAAVARFRQMIERAPTHMPRIMPMTAAVSPTFAARYPEAAIIFDNLHAMHDVVSDILASDEVPRDQKRARILEAARRYRDDTSYVMSVEEWRDMARMMGVENMGGPSMNFLAEFPAPTVERGAVMAGMEHARMPGMRMDSMPGMEHAKMAQDSARAHRHPSDTTPAKAHAAAHESEHAAGDSAAVVETVERFHAALAAGDSTGALALLGPDVVILESGGAETRDEYRSHHLAADIAFAQAVKSERGPMRAVVRGDAAWVTSTSTTTGEYRGRHVHSTGTELVVLSRTPEGWRISAIHWSSRARRTPGD